MTKPPNKCVNKKFKELRKNHPLREGGRQNKELEFAHIQPTKLKGRGRGKNHRYYDIIKTSKLLCPLNQKNAYLHR